jgi:adenine-specific DNA-methyltransferase
VITAARLRRCDSACEVFALLRELGYEVAPIEINAAQWRRAGIAIAWDDNVALHLAARMPQLDIYVIRGATDPPDAHAVTTFLRSLTSYNALVKPVAVCVGARRMTIHDLSSRREPRRLDLDLDHPTVYAIDRLNLLTNGNDPSHVFDRALDRESLTRQFFERFRRAARDLAHHIRVVLPYESQDAADGQSLLLLSRLLFLYFIQQKGWLNGERRFLVDRMEAALREGRGIHATVLAPLFFGCLNTTVIERDDTVRRLGNVPYLNGGLFEPSPFEVRNPTLELPDDLLRRIVDDGFERFAFSIDESDVAGAHIDPEMLGKVFESLMAADERLSTGSFYTPREIVDVLAARAIVAWLSEGDQRTRETLDLILRGEVVRPPANAASLLQRLESVVILDPACGSGAFLLSALRIVERLLAALSPGESSRARRRGIVERSLFGVDLKPQAVRLCELRLWLAIVSQTDEPADCVQPLPNLDRNILQGNSLLSPTDFLGDNRGDIYREWVYALRAQADLIARYRNAPHRERATLARLIRANDRRLTTELLEKAIALDEREQEQLSVPQRDLFGRMRAMNLDRCRDLHERIHANRRTLERIEEGEVGFFSFDIHFAHVMARGGFDVIVGNPPWVRNSRIDPQAKRMYSERFALFRGEGVRRSAAFHQPDLAIAFVERALALMAPGGVSSMLVPAKLLNAGYAAPLRRHAVANLTVLALDDWSSDARRHFEADTFPLGITLAHRDAARPASCVSITSGGESFALPVSALSVSGAEWALLPPGIQTILARIHASHPPLASTLDRAPMMGVKTGDNGAFFLDVKRIRGNALETTDGLHIPLTAVCRCVRGRDVRRWQVAEPAWMLWPPAGGWRQPPRWAVRLAEARGVGVETLKLSYVRPEHVGIKVVWKDLSRGLCAAVLEDSIRTGERRIPLVPNQTLYSLDAASLDEAQVLAALLNSTIVNVLAVAIAERAKDFFFRYFGRTVARLPLPAVTPSSDSWARLLRAARRAGRNPDRAAEEIDAAVASVYGVSADEHVRLSRFLRRRLGMAAE